MSYDAHPMIPVPDAIRAVMRETARVVAKHPKSVLRIPLSTTPWSKLLGYVLAEDVVMKEPGYPPYNASIMDGYAINIDDLTCDTKGESFKIAWTHQVVDKVYAGGANLPNSGSREDNTMDTGNLPTACYITTGAVVPEPYNCVVPLEECDISPSNGHIRIKDSATLQHNKWIRPIGCDIPPSSIVLPKGHIIDPVAVGLMKQSGAEYISVRKRIVVGVLSTGNELDDGWQQQKGKIPDVNRPVLLGLLSSSTFQKMCEPIDLGTVRDDDIDAMVEIVENALDRCDIIITSGGVSMGETDIVERVLVERCGGTLHFGRMHMKPGKPTTFVTVPREVDGKELVKLVFAQPGNPCSAVVCTRLLVGPCVQLYFDGIDENVMALPRDKITEDELEVIVNGSYVHAELEARLAHDVKLDPKRPEYHRVVLKKSEQGHAEVYDAYSTGVQRSSRLMSLRDAQGLMLLPHVKGIKKVARKGETYPVLLLDNTFAKDPVRIRDSIHLRKKAKKELKVSVIQVQPLEDTGNQSTKLDETCDCIQRALSSDATGNEAIIVSKASFSRSVDELHAFVVEKTPKDVDIVVVPCVSFVGCFQRHLDITNALRNRLSKVANSLALQARLGSASQDPNTALFEALVGYIPSDGGAMVICLHEDGVHGALSNIKNLIPRAVRLARGI